MLTTAENNDLSFDPNEIENTVEDLYNLHKSGGNDSSAEGDDESNENNLPHIRYRL